LVGARHAAPASDALAVAVVQPEAVLWLGNPVVQREVVPQCDARVKAVRFPQPHQGGMAERSDAEFVEPALYPPPRHRPSRGCAPGEATHERADAITSRPPDC